MYDLSLIEDYYKKYITNLEDWIPEDIYFINLNVLQRLDLLHFQKTTLSLSFVMDDFHVVHSSEKAILMNKDFIIWITPDPIGSTTMTYILVARSLSGVLKLELAFIASGIYNTSSFILKVLEKFLLEIKENEEAVLKLI